MSETEAGVLPPADAAPSAAARRERWDWIEKSPRRAGCFLAVLALVVRLIYLFQISRTPFYYPSKLDPLFYFTWAREIASGHWIGDRIFIQSPLYAYLLALCLRVFGERILPVLFFQVLVGVGTCLLTFRIGRRLLGETEAFAAGVLVALYGPFLFYEGMVMKTFLSTFLTVYLVDLLLRSEGTQARLLTLSGFVFALTSLVRDNFVLLYPVLLAGILLAFRAPRFRERLRACALFTLGAAAGILPVTLRNFAVGGEFALLTTGGGEVFYIGNNPDANGRYLPPPFVHADPVREHDDFIAKAGELSGKKLTPGGSSRFWFHQGLNWIADNPGAWCRLLLKKLIVFWNSYELPDNYNYYEVRQVLLHPISLPGALLAFPLYFTFGLVAPLGLAGIFLTWRRWRDFLVIHLVVFGYMGTVLLFFNFSRFRVPIVPFLCLFAGSLLVSSCREMRSWVAYYSARGGAAIADSPPPPWNRLRKNPLLLTTPALFLAALLTFNLVGTGGRGVFPTLQTRLSLGDTYRNQGRYEEAEKEYRLGLQILGEEQMNPATTASLGVDPGRMRREVENERMAQGVNFTTVLSGLHFGLGSLWIAEGKELLEKDHGRGEEMIRRGTREIEKAVKVVPYPPHLRRLAEAYSLLGQTEEAEKTYRLGLNLSPEDFGMHYDLAGLLYEHGRYPEALAELQAMKRAKPRLDSVELSDYHYGMGLLRLDGYHERGKALYHLNRALEAYPDHRERHRIQELVSGLTKSGVRPEREE